MLYGGGEAPPRVSRQVDVDLSGFTVPELVVTPSIRGVQSFVLSANYKQKAFFTKHTMESIRDAIAGSRTFMTLNDFDRWERLCCGGQRVVLWSDTRPYSKPTWRERKMGPMIVVVLQTNVVVSSSLAMILVLLP